MSCLAQNLRNVSQLGKPGFYVIYLFLVTSEELANVSKYSYLRKTNKIYQLFISALKKTLSGLSKNDFIVIVML